MITPAEGDVVDFKRGTFKRLIQKKNLPRALGSVAVDLGAEGAEHQLSLIFLNVDPDDVADLRDRLDDLHNPATGRITGGTLEVPGHGTFNNCVFQELHETGKVPVGVNITPTDPNGDLAYNMSFELTFLQTRRNTNGNAFTP
jgi:prophage DNA circulation protein